MKTDDSFKQASPCRTFGRTFCRSSAKTFVSALRSAVWLAALSSNALAIGLPAAGWHRGDVSAAQENSRKAIVSALRSPSPNIEVDVLDFTDESGQRVGLLVHDYEMQRTTGARGTFSKKRNFKSLPANVADPALPPEPFITVIDLFEMIREAKAQGIIPLVSLDMKAEGEEGRDFGCWLGELIRKYGFQDHVFASSFFKSNVTGVEQSCPECLTGGLVFKDHFALRYLDCHYTSLDLPAYSRMAFFLGFPGKKETPHDFVLIQDEILFSRPDLIDYWKTARGVKFVGIFVSGKADPYSENEWQLLKKADWLELDPPQMRQWLQNQTVE